MADSSKIEWTDATWNPVTGCTKVSPGCDHCYAETFAERWRGVPGHHFEQGFDVTLRPERLGQPLRWKKPRRIFVNSMSDLFHAEVPDEHIASVFAVMAAAHWHTFQVLTKRHGRMRSLLSDPDFRELVKAESATLAQEGVDILTNNPWEVWPLRNVWLGVSVEDQKWADLRIPALLKTPAAVRFLSAEPLLGPVDLKGAALRPYERQQGGYWEYGHGEDAYGNGKVWVPAPPAQLDWVIVGGESGPGARPIHPDWVRSLRDQCTAADVPFFFKQWGEWIPESLGAQVISKHTAKTARYADLTGGHRPANVGARNGAATCHRVGKKVAGRELDGRTWDEFPQPAEAHRG